MNLVSLIGCEGRGGCVSFGSPFALWIPIGLTIIGALLVIIILSNVSKEKEKPPEDTMTELTGFWTFLFIFALAVGTLIILVYLFFNTMI